MTHVIWQAKMKLDKYNFTDMMDGSVTEYQGDFCSDELEKMFTRHIIPKIKVKKEKNNETRKIDVSNHLKINGTNQNTTKRN